MKDAIVAPPKGNARRFRSPEKTVAPTRDALR